MTRNISLVILLAGTIGLASARGAGAACGDGTLDPGEQCDLGTGNGGAPTCCTTLCEFRAVGRVGRPAAGPWEVREGRTGTTPSCPADALQPNGTVCRPGTGTCDPAETCDGVNVSCPPDTFAPDGTPCNDGSACTDNDACFRGACVGTTNVDACLDDFFCYRTRAS